MQILLARTQHGFVPADEQAQDETAKVRVGATVMAELKRARNPRQHALYWATINSMFENQNHPARYLTVEQFHVAVKMALGWYDEQDVKGRTVTIPRSTSFANMAPDEFEPMLNLLLDLAARVMGTSPEAVRDHVNELVGKRLEIGARP